MKTTVVEGHTTVRLLALPPEDGIKSSSRNAVLFPNTRQQTKPKQTVCLTFLSSKHIEISQSCMLTITVN
jgi:hypothetical protein